MFETEIRKQVNIAIEEANAIMFMVDAAVGLTDLDSSMANMLRRSTKPVYVCVNKVDNSTRALEGTEFYGMGFEHNYFVSSISGSGTGELLDAVTTGMKEEPVKVVNADLPEGAEPEEEVAIPKIAIMGQPNVGKSSLLNAMIGQNRTIVSDIAGTTRDTIHTHYNMFQKEFVLIDTAGIRRKNKEKDDLEFYSIIRAIKAMDEADVCLMMIDAQSGITQQDLNIFSLAVKKGKGIVVLVNKWDTVKKETNTARDYEKELKERLAPFNDVPILFISATEKLRIMQAIESALEVVEHKQTKIPTAKLNDVIQKSIQAYHPPVVRGVPVSIKYVTQLPTAVPSFAFFCNHPDDVKQPCKNYLENQLRKAFNFKGVPIRLFFRKK
jgi:GTP-binding protein